MHLYVSGGLPRGRETKLATLVGQKSLEVLRLSFLLSVRKESNNREKRERETKLCMCTLKRKAAQSVVIARDPRAEDSIC